MIAIGQDGPVVVVTNVFALLEGEIFLNGDEGLRHFGDGHYAGAVGVDF